MPREFFDIAELLLDPEKEYTKSLKSEILKNIIRACCYTIQKLTLKKTRSIR